MTYRGIQREIKELDCDKLYCHDNIKAHTIDSAYFNVNKMTIESLDTLFIRDKFYDSTEDKKYDNMSDEELVKLRRELNLMIKLYVLNG